jgi:hypothetical protein
MHDHSGKPRRGPREPAGSAAPPARGRLELKLRPSGKWAVFEDGVYVSSTGTANLRLAAIRLRMIAARPPRTIH